MPYAEADTGEASPNLFFYLGSNFDEQRFDAPCRSDHIVARASDYIVSDYVSAEDSETDREEPKDGPYEVGLNRVIRMLGEDRSNIRERQSHN